jgi:hypothetical protein
MRLQNLMKKWSREDFDTAVDWYLDWIAGDVPAANLQLERAIEANVIDQTDAGILDGFMQKTLLPYKDLPSIQHMNVSSRLNLMRDLSMIQ